MRHERTNLESELRANRPVPSHELVNWLEGRVREAAAPAPVRPQQASGGARLGRRARKRGYGDGRRGRQAKRSVKSPGTPVTIH